MWKEIQIKEIYWCWQKYIIQKTKQNTTETKPETSPSGPMCPRYWQRAVPEAPQSIALNSWGPPSAPALHWCPRTSGRVSSQQRWSGLGLGFGVAERKGKKRRKLVNFRVRALLWEQPPWSSTFYRLASGPDFWWVDDRPTLNCHAARML